MLNQSINHWILLLVTSHFLTWDHGSNFWHHKLAWFCTTLSLQKAFFFPLQGCELVWCSKTCVLRHHALMQAHGPEKVLFRRLQSRTGYVSHLWAWPKSSTTLWGFLVFTFCNMATLGLRNMAELVQLVPKSGLHNRWPTKLNTVHFSNVLWSALYSTTPSFSSPRKTSKTSIWMTF